MTYQEVLEYFHDDVAEMAKQLNCERQAIYMWHGQVPKNRQLQIELITKGRLKADPACFPHNKRP